MATIKQLDKRSGITYIYDSVSYWDKEKKQSRAKRKLIGRLDPKTGKIVPTDGRVKNARKKAASNSVVKPGPVPIVVENRRFYGACYLLDQIGMQLGITDDLKECFPKDYRKMLSLVYYMILESESAMGRFEKWSDIHRHPYDENISSQRASELFYNINEDNRNNFLRLRGKRHADTEYWAYDTTSISSYSQTLRQVQYGNNKEDDKLPQLNLALICGEKTGLPFYYRKLAGNIPDVITLKTLLAEFNHLGFEKVKLVMDRGFYSKNNINGLFKEHLKFIVAVQKSVSVIKNSIDSVYDSIRNFDNLDEQYGLYATTVTTEWKYQQERPYKKDKLSSSKRVYVHIYFNNEKYAEDETAFDMKLIAMRKEIVSGKTIAENEPFYRKYFDIKSTPVRGVQVAVKDDVVKATKRYYGYFTLLSNEKMDAITALQLYRNKDVVEKAFSDIKDRLNMRRLLVSSEKSLDGKLFVGFVALIYLSHIKKKMEAAGLFKKYTLQKMLDKLDVIECFETPGHSLRVGELLSSQKDIYDAMGVKLPT